MTDAEFSHAEPSPDAMRSPRMMVLALVLAFLLGGVLASYIAWESGWSPFADEGNAAQAAATAPAGAGEAELLAAAPGESEDGRIVVPAEIALAVRLEALERRLNRLDLQAEAASGNAARAEGLLIAFAARRLLERGAQLGYLENQLQLRFGNAQPNAVRTLITAARNPVTLDSLRQRLERMSADAVEEPETESGWDRLRSEISDLFVLRSADTPSPQPELRLERARELLDVGRVEPATALVARLPNQDATQSWLRDARRYVSVQNALDLIETAALLEPRSLMDAQGQPVRQRSPASAPGGAQVQPSPPAAR